MSVLNQSGEEQVECPLCMEPLEVDDLNFYPCTCGYQICRFCWHRIRTDENGLCPACRKAYSEDPADFIPLSQEQVAKLKAEKRQRDQQRKAKLSESRKHLASVRVVQRNLVFVVGLPMRLADPEVLKRHEYFGKFGKIHKVVINQSTSYAGSQGPSASAYVTYLKSDDALRAIQSVNNVTIDGRLIKSSLGTTKYCSHFMKNQACPKPDCMYLHDFGDPEASFTKEEMHAGKHQEYEKKLHEALLQRTTNNNQNSITNSITSSSSSTSTNLHHLQHNLSNEHQQQQLLTNNNSKTTVKNKEPQNLTSSSSSSSASSTSSQSSTSSHGGGTQATNKENWPQLNPDKLLLLCEKDANNSSSSSCSNKKSEKLEKEKNKTKLKSSKDKKKTNDDLKLSSSTISKDNNSLKLLMKDNNGGDLLSQTKTTTTTTASSTIDKLSLLDDNSSFFSHNHFQKIAAVQPNSLLDDEHSLHNPNSVLLNDCLPDISTTEDWAAAFGFSKLDDSSNLIPQQQIHSQNNHTTNSSSSNNGSEQQQQQQQFFVRQSLNNSANNHNLVHHHHHNDYHHHSSMFDVSKLQENLIDTISNKSNNGYKSEQNYFGKDSGLDQHMSKFFMDFHVKNGQKQNLDYQSQHHLHQPQQQQQNGLNGFNTTSSSASSNNHISNGYFMNNSDRFFLLQQRKIEEHLMNLSMKNNYPINNGGHYLNGGDVLSNGFGGYHQQPQQNRGSLYNHQTTQQQAPKQNSRTHSEDELDFDPFQETQKAFAELMASEQTYKPYNNTVRSTGQLNGGSGGGGGGGLNKTHLPPPPPGFVQANSSSSSTNSAASAAHMNSFGSKILPFLNMSNQQINSPTQQNWPSYSQIPQQPQQQQHKNMNSCNDWKDFDSAIVTTSRHYPLNMAPMRDHFSTLQQQLNGGIRGGDYSPANNAFGNFSQLPTQQQQQQQQSFNNFSPSTSQQQQQQQGQMGGQQQQQQAGQNFNWLTSELSTQISSPPGFRNTNQTSKQQEC